MGMGNNMKIVGPALLALSVPVSAMDITWNGFISVVAGQTMDEGTTYLVDPTTGGTYDDQLRFAPESMVALQARSNISDKLSATVQVLGKGGNDFSPDIEWAYVSYEVNENLTVNGGRFRFPVFYYSDSLDVGYSYYWIRPPVDIYDVFFSRVDGVNARYTRFIGPVEFEAQVWYGGVYNTDDSDPAAIQYNDITNNQGIVLSGSWKDFTYRTVYHTTDFSASTRNLVENEPNEFDPFWVQFTSEVGDPAEFEIEFFAHALMGDIGNFLWRSEYTTTTTSFPAFGSETEVTAWYASAGYRWGSVTPHITYVSQEDPGFFGAAADTTVMKYGVAWDFTPGAVFKIEYLDRTVEAGDVETDTSVLAFGVDAMF